MSWPERPTRRDLARAAALALAAGLAACQVRPLYGTPAPGTSAVVPELQRIAVEVQRDRVAQVMMNELIFAMRGGAALTDPAYTLKLIVATRKSELAVQEREEVPTANLITITTTYTLSDNVTGRVVTTGTIYTTASYDFSSQRYANLRAERDAENRAAQTAAQDIRTRIASVFATGR